MIQKAQDTFENAIWIAPTQRSKGAWVCVWLWSSRVCCVQTHPPRIYRTLSVLLTALTNPVRPLSTCVCCNIGHLKCLQEVFVCLWWCNNSGTVCCLSLRTDVIGWNVNSYFLICQCSAVCHHDVCLAMKLTKEIGIRMIYVNKAVD